MIMNLKEDKSVLDYLQRTDIHVISIEDLHLENNIAILIGQMKAIAVEAMICN